MVHVIADQNHLFFMPTSCWGQRKSNVRRHGRLAWLLLHCTAKFDSCKRFANDAQVLDLLRLGDPAPAVDEQLTSRLGSHGVTHT